MAKLTLKQAALIFNRIKTETAFSTGAEDDDSYPYRRRRTAPKARVSFTLNLTVSVDGPVRKQFEAYRNLVINKKEQMFRLMDIGTKIRGELATAQAQAGVTTRVTERVMVVQKIGILDHLLGSIETDTLNFDLVETQADVIQKRLSASTQGNTIGQVSSNVLTAEDRDSLRRELASNRSALLGIDDQLNTLNATHHISVDDGDLEILREAGLAA